MNLFELRDKLETLEVNSEFIIESKKFIFGVTRIELFDIDAIIFASHGNELITYNLEDYTIKEIAIKIKYNIKGNGLTLEECYIK